MKKNERLQKSSGAWVFWYRLWYYLGNYQLRFYSSQKRTEIYFAS